MTDKKDAIVEKIAKLMRLANDAGATEGEKAAAMAAATKLMTAYDIEEAVLWEREEGMRDDLVLGSVRITKSGQGKVLFPDERVDLIACVARFFGCRPVIMEKPPTAHPETGAVVDGGKFVDFVGWANDVSMTLALNAELVMEVNMAVMNEQQKDANYQREFVAGFVMRIRDRLAELTRAKTAAVDDAVKGTSTALAIRDKGQMVADKFNEMWPNTGRVKSTAGGRRFDPNARSRGAAAANRANLGGSASVGGGSRKGLNKS